MPKSTCTGKNLHAQSKFYMHLRANGFLFIKIWYVVYQKHVSKLNLTDFEIYQICLFSCGIALHVLIITVCHFLHSLTHLQF